MATIAFDRGTGPGGAATRPLYASGERTFKIVSGTFAFDSSYPTGGETIADIFSEFSALKGVFFESKLGYTFSVDYSGQKVLAWYADYDAVADGALIQVPNTTNLSTVTGVRFLAYGEK